LSTGSWRRAALVAGLMLVASLLATCTLSTAIPPGAQQVRLVDSHTEVRLDPPTVHGGDVYFVVEGTGALFIQKSGAPGEEGPFTDAELAHLAQTGDLFHTSMQDLTVGYAGNVRKLTLAPGKYALVPMAEGEYADADLMARGKLCHEGTDACASIPPLSMAVLEVLP
jgi:hypothetical protein